VVYSIGRGGKKHFLGGWGVLFFPGGREKGQYAFMLERKMKEEKKIDYRRGENKLTGLTR
jgi:hypothetical protein